MVKEIPTLKPKTWEDVRSLDDCVTEEEARIIRDMMGRTRPENHCPLLKREGEVFHYCGARIPPDVDLDSIPDVNNPKYRASVGSAVLQLFCVGGEERYKKCIDFIAYKRKQTQGT